MKYSTLFSIRSEITEDMKPRMYVDSFMNWSEEEERKMIGENVINNILEDSEYETESLKSPLLSTINALFLRARFNNLQIHLFQTDEELNREFIESFVFNSHENDFFREKLLKSRISG